MLLVPSGSQDFGYKATNQGTTRPSGTNIGTSMTPGQNTKGSWARAFSAIPCDTCGIFIDINTNTGANRNTLVDIGADPAGGSSYSVIIPDLLAPMAITPNKGGIFYYFPLKIPSGASIGVRASVNNATVGTLYAFLTIFGKPKHPEGVKTCSKVKAFGITAASSKGTDVTPGTTSEGAWTNMGSTDDAYWWWQQGFGFDVTTSSDRAYAQDFAIGDGTNYDVVIPDQYWGCDTSLRCNNFPLIVGCERWAPNSSGLYVRQQCSGSLNSGYSAAVYGGA